MKDATAKLVLGLVAGGGAVWGISRWRDRRKKRMDDDEALGADHDADPVTPVLEPIDERSPKPASNRRLTREFDMIFTAFGFGLPVPYLRALAARESGLRANDPNGLISVVRVVREDFNERHGTDVKPDDLRQPGTSVMIASWALRRIIDSFVRNHTEVPNLREDWINRAFVELLTFAWNAGHSERAGLGRVVRYLTDRGQTDITVDDIVANASRAGAKHWLWNRKKLKWSKSVAELYFRELERDVAAGATVRPEPTNAAGEPIDPYADAPTATLSFGRPIPADVRAIVSSGWSRARGDRLHRALDIPVPEGTAINAVDDGVVVRVRAEARGDAGIWVGVKHPSGITSRYLHLSKTLVRQGQTVRRGETIGLSGNTGNSSGPHLHLDLRATADALAQVEAAIGRPATGWGSELKPYGFSIPGEAFVPVDGYRTEVIEDARAANVPLLYPVDAEAKPISHPDQVDAPVGG